MQLAFSLCFVIVAAYCWLIIQYYRAWAKLPEFTGAEQYSSTFISIIIPFRNEEKNIVRLLADLQSQTIDQSQFEIIFVNDHSTDRSVAEIEKFVSFFNHFQILHLSDNEQGKKLALSVAASKAKGNLILSLDADCRVQKELLSILSAFYKTNKSKLIILPVLYFQSRRALKQLFSLEFMSLIASGAGAAAVNKPIMCNGAALVFEKEIFFEAKTHLRPDVPSGDDMFLLQFIKKNYPDQIHFIKSSYALVETDSPDNMKQFINQRIRWTSKSRFYTDWQLIFVSILVFLTSLSLSLSAIYMIVDFRYLACFIVLLTMKMIADFCLLHSFARYFNRLALLKWFLPMQLFYHLYITFMAVYGNMGNYQWKGRKIKTK